MLLLNYTVSSMKCKVYLYIYMYKLVKILLKLDILDKYYLKNVDYIIKY